MTREDQHTDLKSLRTITGKTADWDALAKDCVCFAIWLKSHRIEARRPIF